MRQNNRWHPCLLPDNYQRKLRQDLAESDEATERTIIEDSESESEPEDE